MICVLTNSYSALTRIGYVFMDGPWRDCWFPYGKDPRLDPECFK